MGHAAWPSLLLNKKGSILPSGQKARRGADGERPGGLQLGCMGGQSCGYVSLVKSQGLLITGFVWRWGKGRSVALEASAWVEEGCICGHSFPCHVRIPGVHWSNGMGEVRRASRSTQGVKRRSSAAQML